MSSPFLHGVPLIRLSNGSNFRVLFFFGQTWVTPAPSSLCDPFFFFSPILEQRTFPPPETVWRRMISWCSLVVFYCARLLSGNFPHFLRSHFFSFFAPHKPIANWVFFGSSDSLNFFLPWDGLDDLPPLETFRVPVLPQQSSTSCCAAFAPFSVFSEFLSL